MRIVGHASARSSPPARPGGDPTTLDAADRAELHALRIRAYGPSPDIAGDAVALERLVELEERALPRAAARDDSPDAEAPRFGADPAEAAVAVAAPVVAAAARVVAGEAAPGPPAVPRPRRPRRRDHVAAVAAVAVLAVALAALGGAQAARQAELAAAQAELATLQSAGDAGSAPDGDLLIRVFIDASTGGVDLPSGPDVPAFPVMGEMTWAQPLGEYYGWALWIGAAPSRRGDEHCLLLEAEAGGTRARCVAREWRADGELMVSVPFTQIDPHDRPAAMNPGQSVSFLWGPGGFVTIMLTPGADG